MEKTYNYYGTEVYLEFGKYQSGGMTRIILKDLDGFPYAVATVNVHEKLEEGEVVIKDYSENEGMLLFLVSNGIVSPVLRHTRIASLHPICKLLIS